jgi:hypothetical protein
MTPVVRGWGEEQMVPADISGPCASLAEGTGKSPECQQGKYLYACHPAGPAHRNNELRQGSGGYDHDAVRHLADQSVISSCFSDSARTATYDAAGGVVSDRTTRASGLSR